MSVGRPTKGHQQWTTPSPKLGHRGVVDARVFSQLHLVNQSYIQCASLETFVLLTKSRLERVRAGILSDIGCPPQRQSLPFLFTHQ